MLPLTTFYRSGAHRSDVYKWDAFVTSWRFYNRAWQPQRHDRLPETSGTLWIHRGALTNQRCSLATGCGIKWASRLCVWDIRHWRRHCIFTDESGFKLHHTGRRARVCRQQYEGYIDGCVQETDGNVGPSVIVWAVTMVAKMSWLGWTAPWTNKCTDVCCNKVSYYSIHVPGWLLKWLNLITAHSSVSNEPDSVT